MVRTACKEPHCLYSTAIPLLLVWTVQPAQSLIACTMVHLYLHLTEGFQIPHKMSPLHHHHLIIISWCMHI